MLAESTYLRQRACEFVSTVATPEALTVCLTNLKLCVTILYMLYAGTSEAFNVLIRGEQYVFLLQVRHQN